MAESSSSKSFREKSAWISLVSFVLAFAIYLWNLGRVVAGGPSFAPAPELLLLTALIAGSGALQLAIAVRSPKEARTPKDERERLIDLKATRPAFFVLLVSAFGSIGTVHLPVHGQHLKLLMLGIMLSITLAGIVKFGTQVALYRRDR